MRIVVIGGSGHIGTFLVPRLVRAGHDVISISRGQRSSYADDPAWTQVRQVVADRAAEDREGTFGGRVADLGPDVVIDLICFSLDSATALVERLRGRTAHLLHCGSIWRAGPSVRLPMTEDDAPPPVGEYGIAQGKWIKSARPNRVGNTTGGSWAGVISRHSKVPEATYCLLALMASKEKSMVYAARGWDGLDPGRRFHFLPPDGYAKIEDYLKASWDEADVRDYLHAYLDTFSNPLQLPYLRIPGTYSYLQALNLHLAEAVGGQVSPRAALKATAVSFEEITLRLGRDAQRRAYRTSLGLQ